MSDSREAVALDALAARLGALEREKQEYDRKLAELERTNRRLVAELAALRTERPAAVEARQRGRAHTRGPREGADSHDAAGRTSRRGVLRAVAGVAASAVVGGTLLETGQERALADSYGWTQFYGSKRDWLVQVEQLGEGYGIDAYTASTTKAAIYGAASDYTAGVGVEGRSGGGTGVRATSARRIGLVATSANGTALQARSGSSICIDAQSGGGNPTMSAHNSGDGPAIQATSGSYTVTGPSPTEGGVGVGTTGGAGDAVSASSLGTGAGVSASSKRGNAVQALAGGRVASTSLSGSTAAVLADGGNGYGVYATSEGTREAIRAAGAGSANGASISSDKGIGVYASCPAGYGIQVYSGKTGLFARSSGSHGIQATANDADPSNPSPKAAVVADGGAGYGLYATGDRAAVYGRSDSGYGAHLAGGAAPLRLVPSATIGAPTTGNHLAGELFVDGAGELYICADGGAPGTWRQVTVS